MENQGTLAKMQRLPTVSAVILAESFCQTLHVLWVVHSYRHLQADRMPSLFFPLRWGLSPKLDVCKALHVPGDLARLRLKSSERGVAELRKSGQFPEAEHAVLGFRGLGV